MATNATLVYYAHTGNLEVPYLFWTSFALVEMDRVLAGEPRERAALLLSVAAVLVEGPGGRGAALAARGVARRRAVGLEARLHCDPGS